MSKYSSEFKLEVVQYYLDGKGGFSATAKYFGVNHELLRGWVENFKNKYKLIFFDFIIIKI